MSRMVEISDLSKSECTNPKLRIFSFEHFTYINQIFGDQTIREIIREVFPNKKYLFGVQQTGEEFENSHHHVLIEKKNKRSDMQRNSRISKSKYK